MGKIRAFTDLDAWREAHRLVLMIYRATQAFPKTEQYGLAIQLQQAAVSITSNIAEGFSRRSVKEKKQFYYTSLSSLTEVQNQILIARDVTYLKPEIFSEIEQQSVRVSKLINGMIKSARSYIPKEAYAIRNT
jgi:four helix bundle protein